MFDHQNVQNKSCKHFRGNVAIYRITSELIAYGEEKKKTEKREHQRIGNRPQAGLL